MRQLFQLTYLLFVGPIACLSLLIKINKLIDAVEQVSGRRK